MHLDKIIVAVLVFISIIFAGFMVISDLDTSYGDEVNMSLNEYTGLNTEARSIYGDMYNQTGNMSDHVLKGETDDDDMASSMFKGGYSTMRLLVNLPTITINLLSRIAIKVGINEVFVNMAFVAMTLMLLFSIIYVVFRIAA